MRIGLVGVGIVFSSLFLISCGKDQVPQGPAPRTSVWMANVEVAEDLKQVWASDKIDADKHCVQLVHAENDPEQLLVEIGYGACEAERALVKPEFRFLATARPDPEHLGEPTKQYVIQHQYLPIGLLELQDGAPVLRDLCTLGAYFRASCRLDPIDGQISKVAVSIVAAVDRMDRENLAAKKLEAAQKEAKELKELITKTTAAIKATTGKLEENRSTLSGILTAIEKRSDQLLAELKKKLDGPDGKLAEFKNLLAELPSVETRIEGRGEAIKPLEAALVAAQEKLKKITEDFSALRVKVAAIDEKLAANPPPSEEAAMALANEKKLLTEIRFALVQQWTDANEEFATAFEKFSTDSTVVEDRADRQKLAELKESLARTEQIVRYGTSASTVLEKLKIRSGELKVILSTGDQTAVILELPKMAEMLGTADKIATLVLAQN